MREYTAPKIQQKLTQNQETAIEATVDFLAPNSSPETTQLIRKALNDCFDKAISEAPKIAAELNTHTNTEASKIEASNGKEVIADGGTLPDIGEVIAETFKTILHHIIEQVTANTTLTGAETTLALAACIAIAAAIAGIQYKKDIIKLAKEHNLYEGKVEDEIEKPNQ